MCYLSCPVVYLIVTILIESCLISVFLRYIVLFGRDTDALELKAEEMRSALLKKVKDKTVPVAKQFCAEVASLKKHRSLLKQTGLMDAFVVLAGEKGLKVSVERDREGGVWIYIVRGRVV